MTTILEQRDTLFISHALPEDNEFAMWLSARLTNEGYKVWCEIDKVHGGEHFWNEIDPVIRHQAAKFIFIGSKESIQKQGVRDEWDFARSVQRDNNLRDFIIPINLDGISNNAIIGMTGLGMMPFYNSWAVGLKALIRKLQKDNVPRSSASPLSTAHWLYNPYGIKNSINEKEEKFYSNWVKFPRLPENYYLHGFSNRALADQYINWIRSESLFPVVQHDRYIISFSDSLPEITSGETDTTLFGFTSSKKELPIVVAISPILEKTYRSNQFPFTSDQSNFLVQLIRQAFHEFLINSGLQTYNLANKKLCYFYARQINEDNTIVDHTVKFNFEGKSKSKQLTGKYYDSFWHYGISFNPRLRPFPCFSFKGHIIFSEDGKTIWPDKKKLHSARRSKGKTFYNAAWRDLWLAFLNSLTEEGVSTIGVTIDEASKMWLPSEPVIFTSKRGYNDPVDNARLKPLDDYDIELDDNADFADDFAEEGVDYELDEEEHNFIESEN